MASMKAITVKLPEKTLRRLRDEARATGRSVAELVRERLEGGETHSASVHDLASDLAGALAGSSRAATNERRRFRRS